MNSIARSSHTARTLASLPAKLTAPAAFRLSQINRHFSRPSNSPSSKGYLLRPTRHSTTMSSSIPKAMKGVLVEKTGGTEVLEYRTDLPVPTPKENEVLVHNAVIGINYIDTYFRTGLYPSPKPEILGREAEGTIVSVGSGAAAAHFKVGQQIVWMGTGAYAEYTAIPAEKAFHLPEGLDHGIAAASILQGLTTVTLVEEAAKVEKGGWALVHAAAGGVGQWLVQVLTARGVNVIGTASTDDKRALASKLGAKAVCGYERDELLDTVKTATNGAGVAAVYDGVGKDTFEVSLEAVARKGTVVSFGNASGTVPPLTIANLTAKNVKVCRPTLFNYLVTDEEREKFSGELFELLTSKKIQVGVHKTYPLSEIRQAHEDLEGRKTTGKLLLDPSK